jgi:hypothetical protein
MIPELRALIAHFHEIGDETMTRFHDTPDWDTSNARGIAEALRDEIAADWRWMQQCRKVLRLHEAQPVDPQGYDVVSARQRADRAERRLLRLIAIRREGMGRRPLGQYYELPSGQPKAREEIAR